MRQPEADWPAAPADLAIRAADVHVWRAELAGQQDAQWRSLASALSPEEEFRAHQVPFERDRRRFVACRGILRQLLGRYLGIPAERVGFELGAEGKPGLASHLRDSGLSFNVAHAGDLALIAVGLGRAVGVDLERVRPLADVGPIAEHFFSSREQRAIAALPAERQLEAFFNCWTRKEAVVKARGIGLAEPLGRIEVSLDPGAARLLAIADEPGEADRWELVPLAPAEGFIGALAIEGHGGRVNRFSWGG